MLQLIQREVTSLIGLVLLHIASEELACPRDDLIAARKHELFHLMLHEIPATFAVLNGQSLCLLVQQCDSYTEY